MRTIMGRYAGTLSILFAVFSSYSARADDVTLEALPPHLAFRVEQRQANLKPDGLADVSQAVITRLKVWQPEQFPITVCFMGGAPELRKRIVNAALEWTKHGANIPIDFGPANNPRVCTQSGAYIKIGFAYAGYWSTVGQDSRDLVNANEQSMNFAYWDVNPASEPIFTQTVLHEFGHAIGYQHEHQNPWSSCEAEFNWPVIYTYLAGPPNRWSKETVDHNMRTLNEDGLVGGQFDKKSIMLYTFPKEFYKEGEKSICYALPNYTLSAVDLTFAAEMYPKSAAVAVNARDAAVTFLKDALAAPTIKSDARVRAIQEIELLSAPVQSVEKRRATIDLLQAPSK
jgi:hypothetical protein